MLKPLSCGNTLHVMALDNKPLKIKLRIQLRISFRRLQCSEFEIKTLPVESFGRQNLQFRVFPVLYSYFQRPIFHIDRSLIL